MNYFSATHRLHLFVAAEYGCALSIISHDKWYSVFDSLSFHMNSLKTVAFLWLSLKLGVCWLYVVLNLFSVIPMEVSCYFGGFCSTVALFTTPFWRHWPLSGQDFLSLQLQVFPCFSFIFLDSRTVLLWVEINCFIFCMQL